MLHKKQIRIATQPNIVGQETLESLPKIYGSIKNKVASNKKTFYRNIKMNQKMTIMKHFNKDQIIHEQTNHKQTKGRQQSQKKSIAKQMPMVKQMSKKKLANFSDKYNKLKSFTKHQRYNKSVQADDSESKHKIRFNTIKFLPMLGKEESLQNEPVGYFSQLNTRSPKQTQMKNPLIHLYRQTSIKKVKGAIFQQISRENKVQNRSAMNGSRQNKSNHSKSRIKTDFAFTSNHDNVRRTSVAKTEFSKRIDDEKTSNKIFKIAENKYVIPSKEQEYRQFIEAYKPLNPTFNLKKMVKGNQFQIIPYKDGVYLGNTILDSGVRNGQGVLVTEYSIFQGHFQNNIKIKGFQQNMDGKYTGAFKNDLRDGKGTYEWNNGQFYEGDWKNGKKNGYGIWQSPNGDSYVGNWVNGRQQGKGTHSHKTSVYKGDFMNSLKHGYGEQIFYNGDIFKGNYENGKPHGKGRYEWKDGSIYQGQFKGGYRDGQGILYQGDGSIYKGNYFPTQVKALSKEILNTVWVNRHQNQAKDIRPNIEMVQLQQCEEFKNDILLSSQNRIILIIMILMDQAGKGSKKMNLLNQSYSMKPELFLSSFLKRGYTAFPLIGNYSLFSIKSNSKEEILPFLFQSNSSNNFFMRNSSLVPLLF